MILPVILSTPNAEGQVIHEVLPGQTLWQIAISYEVKVDDIKRMNSLVTNDIFPGERLLIQLNATPVVVTLTSVATLSATDTPSASPIATMVSPSPAVTVTSARVATPDSTSANNQRLMVAAVILSVAILMGGIFARLARKGEGKDG